MTIKTTRFLRSTDHMSLWELSHRWADENPLVDLGPAIPVAVQDILRFLMWGQLRHELSVCKSNGVVVKNWNYIESWRDFVTGENDNNVSDDKRRELYIEFMSDVVKEHDDIIFKHSDILHGDEYDKKYLCSVHVDDHDLVEFCIREEVDYPEFWITEEDFISIKEVYEARKANKDNDFNEQVNYVDASEATIEREWTRIAKEHGVTELDGLSEDSNSGKADKKIIDRFWSSLSFEQQSRLVCRNIATELWKDSPQMTIASIQRHDAIQKFGGARYYPGRDTVRNWIKDLDPRDSKSKSGRPRNTEEN